MPSKPNYAEQDKITVYIPIKNVVKEKTVENELDSLLERGSTSWEERSLENLVQTGENIDEPCWDLNQSINEMSLRDIEKIMGIRHLWDNLCNCGCILEDIGKEWFLPTYMGLVTSDE